MIINLRSILLSEKKWAIFGQASKVVFQVFFIMGLALILQPELYGKLAVVIATTLILSPFSGLGYGNILIKQIKTKVEKYPERFSEMNTILMLTGLFLTSISFLIVKFILDESLSFFIAAILYSFTELILIKVNEIMAQVHLAKNRIKLSSKIYFEISFLRATSVLLFFIITYFFQRVELIDWSLVYFLLISSVSFKNFIKLLKIDSISFGFKIPKIEILKEGVFFSISMSSQGIYNEIDKNVMSFNHGAITTGYYTFAYRLLDLFFFPLRTLYLLTYPKFFEVGYSKKKSEITRYTNRILMFSLSYGIISFPMIFGIVEIFKRIPYLDSYNQAFYMIYFLAPLIFLRSIHYVFADAITGMGFQRSRSFIQVAIAIVNFILCIIFIPQFSWKAAAIVSLISDILLVILIFSLYKVVLKRVVN